MSPETPRRRSRNHGETLLVLTAGSLAVAAIVVLVSRGGPVQVRGALAFGALICVGELARLKLPGGREFAPIASAGGLAYAMLLSVGNEPAVHGPFQVIVVAVAGIVLGAAPHAATGRPVRLDDMARRLLAVALTALAFRSFAGVLRPVEDGWTVVGALLVTILLAGLLEVVLASVALSCPAGTRFRTVLRDEIRIRLPLGTAIGASALLVAVAAHVMGLTALAVCMAPLMVTQVAYRRYSGIRATYLQTIRALSRVTEVGGYVESGHSRRVSRLALRIGRELGLPEPRLLQLEYAALMHDIGQLSLCSPDQAGATVHISAEQQRRIAELGADVVRQTGVLDRVAEIIATQADPHHGSSGDGVDAPSVESRIIRVANAYDDLTGGNTDWSRNAAELRNITEGSGGEYDPRVVRALQHVVNRA